MYMQYLDDIRVNIIYELPLSEIVFDFFDQLKSQTKGYASLDYEFIENKASNLVKMDILLNQEPIDALSIIVHKDFSYERGKKIVEKLREDRKSTRLNSSHVAISYAVFSLKKKNLQ